MKVTRVTDVRLHSIYLCSRYATHPNLFGVDIECTMHFDKRDPVERVAYMELGADDELDVYRRLTAHDKRYAVWKMLRIEYGIGSDDIPIFLTDEPKQEEVK
jgi:hypothetical protein